LEKHCVNSQQPVRRDYGYRLVALALFIAVVGVAAPIPSFWEFYNIPAGTACRPIGSTMAFFLAGIGTPLLTLLLARLARPSSNAGRRLAIAASLLSLVPFPLYYFLSRWIISAHHLTLLP
jgi:hypothetical protein